jgi:hypothetical protein
VRKRTAAWLTWCAARGRRGDGRRGLLAGRAWRALAAAGNRSDHHVHAAVWGAWQQRPSGRLWELLACWEEPESLLAGTFGLAASPFVPAGERAAIGVFCGRRGLVPADPTQRALFFVMTGQPTQHRAADPDDSLLAAAYQAAIDQTRAALRVMLAGRADVDLAGILGGPSRPDGGRRLTGQESRYLVAQLAQRADWDGLWRLIRDLPVIEAVDAVRLLDDRWRPADGPDLALLGRLAGADPGEVAAGYQALRPTRVDVAGSATACAFSADGRTLTAFTKTDPERSHGYTAPGGMSVPPTMSRPAGAWSVFELPEGRLVQRRRLDQSYTVSRLVAGDAILGLAHQQRGRTNRTVVLRWSPGHPMEILSPDPGLRQLLPRPGGVVLEVLSAGDTRLVFWDAAGQVVRDVALHRDLKLPNTRMPPRLLAVDPTSGLLAVSCVSATSATAPDDPWNMPHWSRADYLVMLDREASGVMASSSPEGPAGFRSACFGPDGSLVTTHADWVRLWHRDGDRLEVQAAAEIPGVRGPAVITARGEIAVLAVSPLRLGQVRYLNPDTLADVATSRELAGRYGTSLWASADTGSHALGGPGFIEVVPTSVDAAAVAERPAAWWAPADLATIAAAAGNPILPPAARPLLSLLRDCLNLQLGAATQASAAPRTEPAE